MFALLAAGRYDDDICIRMAKMMPASPAATAQPAHLVTIDTAIFGTKR